jgi:hypothetical protein
MPDNIADDEYVANLLKEEAKEATKTYSLVGLNSKRCVASH